ncbi:sensor domain-containing diguanylate cyclase [Wenxinia saemankumensis]|uniref:diguanylate cyclase n=1 Tax=Wenxinia saemankumensis TaxID=1447782 RepID=A0A1M6GQU0_9RHOB|nr:sensor domain-containing diguanylate cyclase [Wenxinia saemankumensis]SHJ12293.1 diguanylate cyclase (GGDEF) domain-containing protein [Wenxinia saemankumensis]
MKHEAVSPPAPWPEGGDAPDGGDAAKSGAEIGQVAGPGADPSTVAIIDILNIMEQGIVFWSASGRCELHNSRIFKVLELTAQDLAIGMTHEAFRERTLARGDTGADTDAYLAAQIAVHQPYSFDRTLPSGRVVFTNGRPTRGGGYVVTFTDVTDARRAAQDLDRAKRQAEEAQDRAVGLLDQERARQAEAKMLSQLDEWLQSCKSLSELYNVVTHFMVTLLPASKGELYVYSNSRDALDGICNWNTTDLHDSIEADSCWALRRGRAYEFRPDVLCFACEHVAAHEHRIPVEEYICVPIVAHGDTVGLLHIRFDTGAEGAARIADKGPFAVRCAEHISMAIANVRLRDELHERAIRDSLTGLYNRRWFMEALRRDLAQAERRGAPLALVAFDVDDFKGFNDQHGHDAGDLVLRAVADRMGEVVGHRGTCCRTGGEEFAILLPDFDRRAASHLAEVLREAVSASQVRHLDRLLPRITVSCGIAVFPEDATIGQVLMRLADEALYRAKSEGRNCVRLVSA